MVSPKQSILVPESDYYQCYRFNYAPRASVGRGSQVRLALPTRDLASSDQDLTSSYRDLTSPDLDPTLRIWDLASSDRHLT
jgi:hypothetical protein